MGIKRKWPKPVLRRETAVTDLDGTREYRIVMTNRKNITVEGVENVESFDDEETKQGLLILKGDNLHIIQLNLGEGTLMVEGFCKSLDFSEEKSAKGFKNRGKGLMERILR
jgi:sporulation protein YabP